MARKSVVVIFMLALATAGCDNFNLQGRKAAPALRKPKPATGPLHRFVLTRFGQDTAFDTQTGQLCRTWDWLPAGAPRTGNEALEKKPGQFTPLCLTLYQQFPSGPDDGTQTVEEEPAATEKTQ
jgi:hypothetical protein